MLQPVFFTSHASWCRRIFAFFCGSLLLQSIWAAMRWSVTQLVMVRSRRAEYTNTSQQTRDVVLLLGRRLRRRPNIKTTSGRRPTFAWFMHALLPLLVRRPHGRTDMPPSHCLVLANPLNPRDNFRVIAWYLACVVNFWTSMDSFHHVHRHNYFNTPHIMIMQFLSHIRPYEHNLKII